MLVHANKLRVKQIKILWGQLYRLVNLLILRSSDYQGKNHCAIDIVHANLLDLVYMWVCCPAGLLVMLSYWSAILLYCWSCVLLVCYPVVLLVCCSAVQLACCPAGLLSCCTAVLLLPVYIIYYYNTILQ